MNWLTKFPFISVLIVTGYIVSASVVSFGVLTNFSDKKEDITFDIVIEETPIILTFATPTTISVSDNIIVKDDDLIRYIDINTEATLVCTHLRIDDILIEKINCDE